MQVEVFLKRFAWHKCSYQVWLKTDRFLLSKRIVDISYVQEILKQWKIIFNINARNMPDFSVLITFFMDSILKCSVVQYSLNFLRFRMVLYVPSFSP